MIDNQRQNVKYTERSVLAGKKQTELEAETVATPVNLIMAECELDSLTDGPGVRL